MTENNFFGIIIQQLDPTSNLAESAVSKQVLIDKINALITTDFSRLISILRRMDVSEQKLKMLLTENKNKDAAQIILDLMIERQLERLKTKESFKTDDNIPEDEKW